MHNWPCASYLVSHVALHIHLYQPSYLYAGGRSVLTARRRPGRLTPSAGGGGAHDGIGTLQWIHESGHMRIRLAMGWFQCVMRGAVAHTFYQQVVARHAWQLGIFVWSLSLVPRAKSAQQVPTRRPRRTQTHTPPSSASPPRTVIARR